MSEVLRQKQAYLHIKDGLIHEFGPMDQCPALDIEMLDCSDRLVLPAYVDSHTHLVFAQSRAEEFKMRLQGKSYQEIAKLNDSTLSLRQEQQP